MRRTTFKPELCIEFSSQSNDTDVTVPVFYKTYIEIDTVYILNYYDDYGNYRTNGRVTNIDYNNLMITFDCSKDYNSSIKTISIDYITSIFNYDKDKTISINHIGGEPI